MDKCCSKVPLFSSCSLGMCRDRDTLCVGSWGVWQHTITSGVTLDNRTRWILGGIPRNLGCSRKEWESGRKITMKTTLSPQSQYYLHMGASPLLTVWCIDVILGCSEKDLLNYIYGLLFLRAVVPMPLCLQRIWHFVLGTNAPSLYILLEF